MPRRFLPLILIVLALGAFLAPAATFATEVAGEVKEEHGIPLKPDVLFHLGPLAVTNSMVVTWIVVGLPALRRRRRRGT